MKRIVIFKLVILIIILATSKTFACGLEGSATRTDGSKVDGTAKISTGRNSEVAYPKNGYYLLELGSVACGESAEVFVNGYSLGRYKIPSSGTTTVNVTLKGTSDYPVR